MLRGAASVMYPALGEMWSDIGESRLHEIHVALKDSDCM